MVRIRRTLGSVAVAAMVAVALWVVAAPVQAVQASDSAEPLACVTLADGLPPALAAPGPADGTLFGKSIKDPACKRPCRPYVKTKTGLTCVFVGCFDNTGECAYRC